MSEYPDAKPRPEKKAFHVQMRRESYDRMKAFSYQHGVTMTALMDTIAFQLQRDATSVDLTVAVEDARRIDGERRFRGSR